MSVSTTGQHLQLDDGTEKELQTEAGTSYNRAGAWESYWDSRTLGPWDPQEIAAICSV